MKYQLGEPRLFRVQRRCRTSSTRVSMWNYLDTMPLLDQLAVQIDADVPWADTGPGLSWGLTLGQGCRMSRLR